LSLSGFDRSLAELDISFGFAAASSSRLGCRLICGRGGGWLLTRTAAAAAAASPSRSELSAMVAISYFGFAVFKRCLVLKGRRRGVACAQSAGVFAVETLGGRPRDLRLYALKQAARHRVRNVTEPLVAFAAGVALDSCGRLSCAFIFVHDALKLRIELNL
jgi:hypothetical protein